MRRLLALLMVPLAGCVWLSMEPADPEGKPSHNVGWGRTSALNETVTVVEAGVTTTTTSQLICSSGITGIFSNMLCEVVSVVGGVFGSASRDCGMAQQMAECAGLLVQGEDGEE